MTQVYKLFEGKHSDFVIADKGYDSDEFRAMLKVKKMEAVLNGEVIETYEDDKPYPSYLLYGETNKGRPIHVVIAYNEMADRVIIITTYQPTQELWISFKRRKK